MGFAAGSEFYYPEFYPYWRRMATDGYGDLRPHSPRGHDAIASEILQ